MARYTMIIKDAREGEVPHEMHVYLDDPLWGDNTFKIYPNYWTGAMFGTYKYYATTKSIVFTKTSVIDEDPYICMRWYFLIYPDDCRAGSGKSGAGEVYTNFNPGLASPIRWASDSGS